MEHLPPIIMSGDDNASKSTQPTERTTTTATTASPRSKVSSSPDSRTAASPRSFNFPDIHVKKDGKETKPEKSKPRSSKKTKKRSPKKEGSVVKEATDDASVSSYDSSSGSSSYYTDTDGEGSSRRSRTAPTASPKPACTQNSSNFTSTPTPTPIHGHAISCAAFETTSHILNAATTSAKVLAGVKKHLQADLSGNGRHVLLTKGATVPHIHLTVDASTAVEIATLASKEHPKLASLSRSGTVSGANSRLLRAGVPTELMEDMQLFVESDSTPGFAKKTVACLINEANHAVVVKQPHHPVVHTDSHHSFTHAEVLHTTPAHVEAHHSVAHQRGHCVNMHLPNLRCND